MFNQARSNRKWLLCWAVASMTACPWTDCLAPQQGKEFSKANPTVVLFVATRDLTKGMVIKGPSKCIVAREVEINEAPEGAILTSTQLGNRKLKNPVSRGSILTQHNFLTDMEAILGAVPPGHFAMPVHIDAACLCAGWWLPGDRVDIILVKRSQTGEFVGATVCRNALILDFNPDAISFVAIRPDQALCLCAAQAASIVFGGKLLFVQAVVVQ